MPWALAGVAGCLRAQGGAFKQRSQRETSDSQVDVCAGPAPTGVPQCRHFGVNGFRRVQVHQKKRPHRGQRKAAIQSIDEASNAIHVLATEAWIGPSGKRRTAPTTGRQARTSMPRVHRLVRRLRHAAA